MRIGGGLRDIRYCPVPRSRALIEQRRTSRRSSFGERAAPASGVEFIGQRLRRRGPTNNGFASSPLRAMSHASRNGADPEHDHGTRRHVKHHVIVRAGFLNAARRMRESITAWLACRFFGAATRNEPLMPRCGSRRHRRRASTRHEILLARLAEAGHGWRPPAARRSPWGKGTRRVLAPGLDAHDLRAHHSGLQAAPDGLDLEQFGHAGRRLAVLET